MPFKELLLLAMGVALCLGSAVPELSELPELPEIPEISQDVAEGRVSSRYGENNKYYLYNREHYRNPAELTLDNIYDDTNSSTFNPAHKYTENKDQTVVIVHGHGGNRDSQLNRDLINAFLTRSDRSNGEFEIDIIVVDWEYFASLGYIYSPLTVPGVANYISNLLVKLDELNAIDIEKLHLVGFDLGAHVVGFVGRTLRATKVVGRITALDPALESWGPGSHRLRNSDANYVEVIHTDAFGTRPLGIADAIGHVDVYPNGGSNQPGCSNNNECNHNRAWQLYVATVIIHDRIFEADGCNSITEVTANRCTGLPMNVGAVALDKFANGLYRGTTTAAYPYF